MSVVSLTHGIALTVAVGKVVGDCHGCVLQVERGHAGWFDLGVESATQVDWSGLRQTGIACSGSITVDTMLALAWLPDLLRVVEGTVATCI